ncbi:hypothetical protein ACFX2I_012341 [Malus domestica]
MMTASSTSLIQRVCAVLLARTACTPPMAAASMNLSTTTTTAPKSTDPQVLICLFEPELQQLAIDFSQNELEEVGWIIGRSPIYQSVTVADGTVKVLIKLEDNRLIETVGIPVKDEKGVMHLTACISSQVGCLLCCSFLTVGIHQLVFKQHKKKKDEAYIPKLLMSVQILSTRLKEIFPRMTQETQL